MKRRDFLCSAGAAAVIPVLPLPAMAIPAATAPVNAMQVGWAALYARANNAASPALIQKWLRVGPEQAHALMAELTKRNIIQLPIAGSATAVQPMYPGGGYAGMFNKSRQVTRKAKDVFDALTQDETPIEVVEDDDTVLDQGHDHDQVHTANEEPVDETS